MRSSSNAQKRTIRKIGFLSSVTEETKNVRASCGASGMADVYTTSSRKRGIRWRVPLCFGASQRMHAWERCSASQRFHARQPFRVTVYGFIRRRGFSLVLKVAFHCGFSRGILPILKEHALQNRNPAAKAAKISTPR
jgi:hypothetical protein